MQTQIGRLFCIVAVVALSACGGGGGGGGSLSNALPNQPGSVGASSPGGHIVYFSSQGFNNPLLPASIWGFNASGTGAQPPGRTIEISASTDLFGLATDAAGDVYTSYFAAGGGSKVLQIVEFGPGDNTTPIRTISFTTDGVQSVDSIAVTPDGAVFVLDSFAPPGCSGVEHLLEFSANSSGNTAPVRDITGSNTQIGGGGILTVGADGTAYFGIITSSTPTSTTGNILRFGPSANGNVPPDAVISGSNTHVGQIWQMATTSTRLVVSSRQNSSLESGDILEFPLDANGNVSPSKDISLARTAIALALDSAGNYYAYDAKNQVSVFAPSASGTATPMNVFEPAPAPPPFSGCGSCTFLSPMAAH